MESISNDRDRVFKYLATTSMVKMSTSAVLGGIVRDDYVIVHEASPRVVQEIVGNFRMVSLTPEGLLIPLTPAD